MALQYPIMETCISYLNIDILIIKRKKKNIYITVKTKQKLQVNKHVSNNKIQPMKYNP